MLLIVARKSTSVQDLAAITEAGCCHRKVQNQWSFHLLASHAAIPRLTARYKGVRASEKVIVN